MEYRHALAIAEMHDLGCKPVRIVAICDADATRRSRIAALLESRCGLRPEEFAEAPALLTHPGVEAVQIVLPTSLHHKMVLAALEAGKHVLVEKPMALTVAACDQIVMAAQQGDRVVAVAENYRRIPANRAMGALIRSGSLGPSEPCSCATLLRPIRPSNPVIRLSLLPAGMLTGRHAGGYHVMEMGVHEADLQHDWFGPVRG